MSFNEHPNADRDWEVIRDAASSDSEKAHAYNRLAGYHNLNRLEYNTAVRYALEAERFFAKCGDLKNVGDSLYIAGDASFNLEKYSDALAYFSKAADIFRAEVDQFYLAFCIDRMADCYSKLDQPELAIASYRNSAQMYEVEQNFKHAAEERLEAASSLNAAKNYAEAELEATLAMSLLEKAESKTEFAKAHIVRGFALLQQNSFDAAISDFNSAISLVSYEPESHLDGLAYLFKAKCLFDQRNFDESRSNISLARKAFKKNNSPDSKSQCDLLEAKLCFQIGENLEAQALAQKSRAFFAHTDKEQTAEADALLARIEEIEGDQDSTIECYETAMKSFLQLGNPEPDAYKVCVDYASYLINTPNLNRLLEVLDLVPHVEFLNLEYQLASHNMRARAHYLLNQYDRSLEVLEQVFALTGEDWESRDYSYAIETQARALADTGSPNAAETLQYAVNLLTAQGIYSARYLAQQLREMQTQAS